MAFLNSLKILEILFFHCCHKERSDAILFTICTHNCQNVQDTSGGWENQENREEILQQRKSLSRSLRSEDDDSRGRARERIKTRGGRPYNQYNLFNSLPPLAFRLRLYSYSSTRNIHPDSELLPSPLVLVVVLLLLVDGKVKAHPHDGQQEEHHEEGDHQQRLLQHHDA